MSESGRLREIKREQLGRLWDKLGAAGDDISPDKGSLTFGNDPQNQDQLTSLEAYEARLESRYYSGGNGDFGAVTLQELEQLKELGIDLTDLKTRPTENGATVVELLLMADILRGLERSESAKQILQRIVPNLVTADLSINDLQTAASEIWKMSRQGNGLSTLVSLAPDVEAAFQQLDADSQSSLQQQFRDDPFRFVIALSGLSEALKDVPTAHQPLMIHSGLTELGKLLVGSPDPRGLRDIAANQLTEQFQGIAIALKATAFKGMIVELQSEASRPPLMRVEKTKNPATFQISFQGVDQAEKLQSILPLLEELIPGATISVDRSTGKLTISHSNRVSDDEHNKFSALCSKIQTAWNEHLKKGKKGGGYKNKELQGAASLLVADAFGIQTAAIIHAEKGKLFLKQFALNLFSTRHGEFKGASLAYRLDGREKILQLAASELGGKIDADGTVSFGGEAGTRIAMHAVLSDPESKFSGSTVEIRVGQGKPKLAAAILFLQSQDAMGTEVGGVLKLDLNKPGLGIEKLGIGVLVERGGEAQEGQWVFNGADRETEFYAGLFGRKVELGGKIDFGEKSFQLAVAGLGLERELELSGTSYSLSTLAAIVRGGKSDGTEVVTDAGLALDLSDPAVREVAIGILAKRSWAIAALRTEALTFEPTKIGSLERFALTALGATKAAGGLTISDPEVIREIVHQIALRELTTQSSPDSDHLLVTWRPSATIDAASAAEILGVSVTDGVLSFGEDSFNLLFEAILVDQSTELKGSRVSIDVSNQQLKARASSLLGKDLGASGSIDIDFSESRWFHKLKAASLAILSRKNGFDSEQRESGVVLVYDNRSHDPKIDLMAKLAQGSVDYSGKIVFRGQQALAIALSGIVNDVRSKNNGTTVSLNYERTKDHQRLSTFAKIVGVELGGLVTRTETELKINLQKDPKTNAQHFKLETFAIDILASRVEQADADGTELGLSYQFNQGTHKIKALAGGILGGKVQGSLTLSRDQAIAVVTSYAASDKNATVAGGKVAFRWSDQRKFNVKAVINLFGNGVETDRATIGTDIRVEDGSIKTASATLAVSAANQLTAWLLPDQGGSADISIDKATGQLVINNKGIQSAEVDAALRLASGNQLHLVDGKIAYEKGAGVHGNLRYSYEDPATGAKVGMAFSNEDGGDFSLHVERTVVQTGSITATSGISIGKKNGQPLTAIVNSEMNAGDFIDAATSVDLRLEKGKVHLNGIAMQLALNKSLGTPLGQVGLNLKGAFSYSSAGGFTIEKLPSELTIGQVAVNFDPDNAKLGYSTELIEIGVGASRKTEGRFPGSLDELIDAVATSQGGRYRASQQSRIGFGVGLNLQGPGTLFAPSLTVGGKLQGETEVELVAQSGKVQGSYDIEFSADMSNAKNFNLAIGYSFLQFPSFVPTIGGVGGKLVNKAVSLGKEKLAPTLRDYLSVKFGILHNELRENQGLVKFTLFVDRLEGEDRSAERSLITRFFAESGRRNQAAATEIFTELLTWYAANGIPIAKRAVSIRIEEKTFEERLDEKTFSALKENASSSHRATETSNNVITDLTRRQQQKLALEEKHERFNFWDFINPFVSWDSGTKARTAFGYNAFKAIQDQVVDDAGTTITTTGGFLVEDGIDMRHTAAFLNYNGQIYNTKMSPDELRRRLYAMQRLAYWVTTRNLLGAVSANVQFSTADRSAQNTNSPVATATYAGGLLATKTETGVPNVVVTPVQSAKGPDVLFKEAATDTDWSSLRELANGQLPNPLLEQLLIHQDQLKAGNVEFLTQVSFGQFSYDAMFRKREAIPDPTKDGVLPQDDGVVIYKTLSDFRNEFLEMIQYRPSGKPVATLNPKQQDQAMVYAEQMMVAQTYYKAYQEGVRARGKNVLGAEREIDPVHYYDKMQEVFRRLMKEFKGEDEIVMALSLYNGVDPRQAALLGMVELDLGVARQIFPEIKDLNDEQLRTAIQDKTNPLSVHFRLKGKRLQVRIIQFNGDQMRSRLKSWGRR